MAMATRQSQAKRMLEYIRQNGHITYREAEVDLCINSPRDVMSELRKTHNVTSCYISKRAKDEKGRLVTMARFKVFYIEE